MTDTEPRVAEETALPVTMAAAATAPAGHLDGQEALVAVKVWDLPLRLMHWTLVASIIVLSGTGLYIAHPFVASGKGAATGYVMGTVRAVHIATGWIFMDVMLARLVWAFLGNRWARWDQLLPARRYRRKMIRPSVEYYMFRRLEPPPVVGHNPLAGATYLVLFSMFALQTFTGFALEALGNPHGAMWSMTGWVYRWIPTPEVRLIHYLVMWLTFGFIVHHVYSAWLVDREEHSGELSSIVTGWKSLPPERIREAPELARKVHG